jgi:hypothetical protein
MLPVLLTEICLIRFIIVLAHETIEVGYRIGYSDRIDAEAVKELRCKQEKNHESPDVDRYQADGTA